MPVTVEFRALHRAIDELGTAVSSLRSTHGEVPIVARLQNDLERLILDVADADTLAAPAGRVPSTPGVDPGPMPADQSAAGTPTDEQYDTSAWSDMDDEGVGGFHGNRTGQSRADQHRASQSRAR